MTKKLLGQLRVDHWISHNRAQMIKCYMFYKDFLDYLTETYYRSLCGDVDTVTWTCVDLCHYVTVVYYLHNDLGPHNFIFYF